MAQFAASQSSIGKEPCLYARHSYLLLFNFVSGSRGIIKGLEDEQARLADGIEVNRVALEDTDSKLSSMHRNMVGMEKSMVRL